MQKFFLTLSLVVILFLGVSVYTSHASETNYWFNNAVDTNPATLGNYWLDADLTVPAESLPDLNVHNLTIAPEATYNGSPSIRGSATNEGTITGNANFYDFAVNNSLVNGNATFYEDITENYGTVSGTKTRHFTVAAYVERDFVTDGPWTIVADGDLITIEASTYDNATTFVRENGGYFAADIFPISTLATNNTISVFYTFDLDMNLIPATSDFLVTVNGNPVAVTDVDIIVTHKAILTLASSVDADDVVLLTYNVTSVAMSNYQGLNVSALTNLSIKTLTPLGEAPVYSTLVGTKLYISNNHGNSVSVIDTLTDTILQPIPVEADPEMSVLVGSKLYVNNLQSDTVTVINTLDDSVVGVIEVGNAPYFSTVVGTKIYISNTNSNTVSVINTLTDTVIATITVGTAPWNSGVIGTKLYVPNRVSSNVSVIDTITDTVVATIPIAVDGAGTNVVAIGTNVYIGTSNSIAVVNTQTDTVTTNITVGTRPYFSCSVGTKLFVPNRGGSTVSVINTLTNTVIATVTVGIQPTTCVVIDSQVFVTRDGNINNTVAVIDSVTNTLVDTLTTGYKPFYATPVGNKLYVSNNFSNNFTAIDTTTITSKLPSLTSFSSTTADGTYIEGQSINITANFGQALAGGSTMTVTLNTGDSVVLSSVSGTTLTGTYTIGSGDTTPDLAVTAISSASVSDTNSHTRTSYSLPSSVGALIAENSFITRNIGDSRNIVIGSYLSIPVGTNPYQVSSSITVDGVGYIYVANQGSNTVSVIKKSDNSVVATIPVGEEAYGVASAVISGTTYVYVANTKSNTVSVINSASNSVVATISVGVKPYYVAAVGTNIYVTNSQSNTVSVINGLTNTVSATIPVGRYPRGIKAYGTNLYVANYGDPNYTGGNTMSVIDSLTNTVTATIILPAGSTGPRGVTVSGSKVYVSNFRSNNVSVINTATNAVVATVSVGTGPRGITPLGSNIYVENFDSGTISVINTATDTVSATIYVGHSPTGLGVSGTDLYVSRFQDESVSILNTVTNTLRPAAPVITNIASSLPTLFSASISWTTDVASDSLVEYGFDTSYGASVYSESSVTSHSITLTNLQAGRSYHFRVVSVDEHTNVARSSDQTFSTAGGGSGLPIIQKPEVISPEPLSGQQGGAIEIEESPSLLGIGLCSKETNQLPLVSQVVDSSLYQRIKGRFTLAVEDRGTVWYIHPTNGYRYRVTIPSALCLLESVVLGISNNNLEKIFVSQTNSSQSNIGKKLRGYILMQSESKGETWYVEPSGSRVMLTINNLLEVAKRSWVGIRNQDLDVIPQYK